MNVFAGVLFHLHPIQLHFIAFNINVTADDYGLTELGNLIAFGQVRVEVVFALEKTVFLRFGVKGIGHTHGILHGLLVEYRQGTGHA